MLALTRLSGSLSLSGMLDLESSGAWRRASPSVVLIIVSWFIVLLAENARVPFDDPNTHLELTMVHEVMVLDHGGPAFGLVVYGAALKLMVFATLLSSVLVPVSTGGSAVRVALSLAAILAIGVVVGLVESSMARLRFLRVPQLLVTATLLAGFAVILLLR
jgi:formate hydrogenlyase subunit 4